MQHVNRRVYKYQNLRVMRSLVRKSINKQKKTNPILFVTIAHLSTNSELNHFKHVFLVSKKQKKRINSNIELVL